MRARFFILLLGVLAFAGCSNLAVVSESKPRRGRVVADPLVTLGLQMDAAEGAWRKFERDPFDAVAQHQYNVALTRIMGVLRDTKLAPWNAPIQTGGHTLEWQPHPNPVWNPALYELIPTDRLKISGQAVDVREIKEGFGAPVVAQRVANQLHDYAPTPHFYFCATIVARFEGTRCVLSIEDPLRTETVLLGNRVLPLAADYTAPLAMMVVEMHPKKLGLPRLLHPAKFAASTRIARLEPFDTNKTVVLLVHGLMSSPATWLPLLNHLRADEDVRRNYQFWFFSYPSGYPYSYSAALLRTELDQAELQYPSSKKMVVIGHSMGGCISRLLITDSEQRIWDQMFTVPPDQMDLTPEHRHIITESAIFNSRPEIGRVIFISSPLRGADMASGWMGRLGARLVSLPGNLIKIGVEEERYVRHAIGHRHLGRFPDSVDTLAPDNEFVRALLTVPIKSGIPYHTIAGDRGRGDAPKSSDGLVPYWSSHLPDALSEKIVPTHHNAQRDPRAIEEVHRILILHSAGSK